MLEVVTSVAGCQQLVYLQEDDKDVDNSQLGGYRDGLDGQE